MYRILSWANEVWGPMHVEPGIKPIAQARLARVRHRNLLTLTTVRAISPSMRKYIAIADDGRGTRSWSIMADGAVRARQQAMDSLKADERLCLIALVTWECEDER